MFKVPKPFIPDQYSWMFVTPFFFKTLYFNVIVIPHCALICVILKIYQSLCSNTFKMDKLSLVLIFSKHRWYTLIVLKIYHYWKRMLHYNFAQGSNLLAIDEGESLFRFTFEIMYVPLWKAHLYWISALQTTNIKKKKNWKSTKKSFV